MNTFRRILATGGITCGFSAILVLIPLLNVVVDQSVVSRDLQFQVTTQQLELLDLRRRAKQMEDITIDYEVVDWAVNHTVKVNASDGQGSGVLVGQGHVLTAAHVVGREEKVLVNGVYEAVVLKVDPVNDLALLHCDGLMEHEAVRFASELPHVGDYVLHVGYQLGRLTVTTGNWGESVSSPIAFGSSGGGVFDTQGRLLGIVVRVRVTGFSVVWHNVIVVQLADIRQFMEE